MDEPIPSVPPIPPAPPTPWFKISLIIIGVLIILGLFGNLYLLVRNQKPIAEVTPTSTPIAATPIPDETANWKTYMNNDYKFSFRYPLDITIKEGNGLETSLLPANQPVYQVVLTKKGQKYFVIETSKNYFPDPKPPLYLNTRSTGLKMIANVLWEEYFIPNDYGEGTPIPSVYALTKENNGVLYGIRFSGQKDTIEEQNQILSTFQFLQ